MPASRGWDSACGTCPHCALLPCMLLPVSSKITLRFCGWFAIDFSRYSLTLTKVCERHPWLIAEGEVGVGSQAVPHLHVPCSAQGQPGLSCSMALPWGHLHPLSWEDGLGWAIRGSPKATAGMEPHAPRCPHRGSACQGASWPRAAPGTAASADRAGSSPAPRWPWQNRPGVGEERTASVGRMSNSGGMEAAPRVTVPCRCTTKPGLGLCSPQGRTRTWPGTGMPCRRATRWSRASSNSSRSSWLFFTWAHI